MRVGSDKEMRAERWSFCFRTTRQTTRQTPRDVNKATAKSTSKRNGIAELFSTRTTHKITFLSKSIRSQSCSFKARAFIVKFASFIYVNSKSKNTSHGHAFSIYHARHNTCWSQAAVFCTVFVILLAAHHAFSVSKKLKLQMLIV
jgi:hypothetical protein